MSRIISPTYKYVSFYMWPTTSGMNPKDPCFLPLENLVWVERGALTQIVIYYSNMKLEIGHDADPEKRIYYGFKEAFAKAMVSSEAITSVSFEGQPVSSVSPWPRNADGSAVSTRKPDIWIKSLTVKAPY